MQHVSKNLPIFAYHAIAYEKLFRMSKRHHRPELQKPSDGARLLHATLFVVFTAALLASGFLWIIPVEVVQQWAFDRAGSGTYDRFEAVGAAEFSIWMSRIASVLLLILIWSIWSDWKGWLSFIRETWSGAIAVTQSSPAESKSFIGRLRTFGFRGFMVAWMVLFAFHSVHGIGQRMREWPYFRFNSGEIVLPNISDSNRAVIRFLQEATPPNARILVASDQKLFFLSYYLRPRVLLHRMHPDSEFVIPLKDQQRKLVAYRLEDLSSTDLEQMPHDFTLEYFEHPDMVDRSKILLDNKWIAFIRRREQNPSLIPTYEVRLRSTTEHSR